MNRYATLLGWLAIFFLGAGVVSVALSADSGREATLLSPVFIIGLVLGAGWLIVKAVLSHKTETRR